jgi:carbonic anhydrase
MKYFVLFLAGALSLSAADANVKPWNQNPADATRGPNSWEGSCRTGTNQSPIVLPAFPANPAAGTRITYSYSNRTTTPVTTNTDAKFTFNDGASITIGTTTYQLKQMHIHTTSEHRVGTTSYPAELHLVHALSDNQLAVIGVFMSTTVPANQGLMNLINQLPLWNQQTPTTRTGTAVAFNPADALPTANNVYWGYSGSLTTPGCAEIVQWQVLRDPIGITQAAVTRLENINASLPNYGGYRLNNRVPVAPGTRPVRTVANPR